MLIPCLAIGLILATPSVEPSSATDHGSPTSQNDTAFIDTWQTTPIGYGANATGGGNAQPVTVMTASQLANAVSGSTPKVVQVSGTIILPSYVNVGSNTTIIGLGSNARITGELRLVNNVNNIIIQNLAFSSTGDRDCIMIKYGATNIWIDHCTFEDAGDGEIDITQNSDFVTVSWCKFLNGNKVSLIGGDDYTTSDAGELHVTFHHNWFGAGCFERMPSVRYGRVHVFNNYYTYGTLTNGAGINFRVGSEVRIENNYFDGVHSPWVSTQLNPLPAGFEQGKSYRSGNLVPNCTDVRNYYPNYADLFTPPYLYTLESASSVKESVMEGAGAGKMPQAAHLWLEAEAATVQSPFAVSSDTSASNDQYIASTQSSTSTAPTSAHVTYTNTLSGTSAVWLRIYCPSGSADSFWVKYGNGSFANFFNTTGVYGSWIWVKWGEVPSSGTLTLAYREANTRLDRVLFTNDLSFTPSGEGQAAHLWLEAEEAIVQSPFAVSSDTSASNDQYIASTQSSTSTAPTNAHVTYTNTLSGTSAVWLRIYCPSGSADSFWVKYGSGSFANFFNTTGVYGSWIWVKWGEVPSSGSLTLAYREANTRLDRVLFTNDLSFTPSGEGP
jgi:pectate lyase